MAAEDEDRSAVHVTITGRVQGVGYRAWTVWEAQERGLQGWVRNRRDGSVEAVFAGPSAQVEEMLDACRLGPSLARVSDLQVDAWDGPLDPGFEARRDG